MAEDFLSRGRAMVKRAVACDETHDYKKAYNCYTIAVDYFEMAVKHEESKPRRRAIQQRLDEYKLRVNLIETCLFFDMGDLRERIAELEREVAILRRRLDEGLGGRDGDHEREGGDQA